MCYCVYVSIYVSFYVYIKIFIESKFYALGLTFPALIRTYVSHFIWSNVCSIQRTALSCILRWIMPLAFAHLFSIGYFFIF
jgi:hypothetical protein